MESSEKTEAHEHAVGTDDSGTLAKKKEKTFATRQTCKYHLSQRCQGPTYQTKELHALL